MKKGLKKKRNPKTRIAGEMYLVAYGLKSVVYFIHVPSFIVFFLIKSNAHSQLQNINAPGVKYS